MEHSVRRQLGSELARLYRADASVPGLLDAAGIRDQELIFWADRPLDTWYGILTRVEVQEQMRDLLEVVIEQYPQDVVFHRAQNQELLQPRPKVPLSQPSTPLLDLGAAEQIMGDESILLPIGFLKRRLECARAVARTVKAQKTASGFLADDDIFITNHHINATEDEARQTTLEFGYDTYPDAGNQRQFTTVAPQPQNEFLTDSENDITLVCVEPGTSGGWGQIPVEAFHLADVRYVNIIQHSSGAPKMIGLYHNVLAYQDSRIIDYYTDTFLGSSGSPVFDSAWRLVGVHRESGHLHNLQVNGRCSAIAVSSSIPW